MRLGCKLPTTGSKPTDPGLPALARRAEQVGVDAVHLSDHLVLVEGARSRYPFSADGRLPGSVDENWYEVLTCCSWVAAATERIEVGPSVLVLPQRHPLELAKTAATIDRLSGGRLFLGVGAGWLREEFSALGWDFDTRAARMDESIDLMRAAWSGRVDGFSGEHVRVPPGVHSRPVPSQHGGVPLRVGGMSKAALRRAARNGDGWIALATYPEPDVESLRTSLAFLASELKQFGRDRGQFRSAIRLIGTTTGEHDQIVHSVRELASMGFDEVAIDPGWDDLDDSARLLASCRSVLDDLDV